MISGEAIGRFFDRYKAELATFASLPTLGIGANQIKPDDRFWNIASSGGLLFVIGVICCFFSIRWSVSERSKSDTLTTTVELLESIIRNSKDGYYHHWDLLCRKICQSLNINSNQRVSIYRFDKVENQFFIVARYSPNPNLCRHGRASYPADQGCIGTAWSQGEAFDGRLPNPANAVKYHETNSTRWRIPVEVSTKLTMHPQCIFAIALQHDDVRFGVIVFESMPKDSLDPDKLRLEVTRTFGDEISQLYHRLQSIEPSCAYARRQGF